MDNQKRLQLNQNSNAPTDDQERQGKNKFNLGNYLTKIAIAGGIVILIGLGLGLGILSRLYYQPRLISFKFEGFSASLPFNPVREEIKGLPPFSNRKLIRYSSAVSPELEYQILVMEPAAGSPETDLDLKTPATDVEMEQWTQSTVAVLCANEQHAIGKNCLQKGSRLTQWHIITADGIEIRGSIFRSRTGQLIQLLATGASDGEAEQFFTSFHND